MTDLEAMKLAEEIERMQREFAERLIIPPPADPVASLYERTGE